MQFDLNRIGLPATTSKTEVSDPLAQSLTRSIGLTPEDIVGNCIVALNQTNKVGTLVNDPSALTLLAETLDGMSNIDPAQARSLFHYMTLRHVQVINYGPEDKTLLERVGTSLLRLDETPQLPAVDRSQYSQPNLPIEVITQEPKAKPSRQEELFLRLETSGVKRLVA